MIIKFTNHPLNECHSYIVVGENNRAIIIDINGMHKEILEQIKTNNYKIEGIFITHGHFDHIWGLPEIYEQLGQPAIYIGREDKEMLYSDDLNVAVKYPGFVTERIAFDKPVQNIVELEKQEKLTFGAGLDVEILPYKVHTPGSCLFYLHDQNALFTGDNLLLEENLNIKQLDDEQLTKIKEFFSEDLKSKENDNLFVYTGHLTTNIKVEDIIKNNSRILDLIK